MVYKVFKFGGNTFVDVNLKQKGYATSIYVDVNLLEKGIYATNIPSLYKEDETIEKITERLKALSKALNISDSYFENLNQCHLVSVELKEI